LARKILLADDSVTAQNMGRKILADAGYEIIAVNNGSAALKKIAETKPDLVILDVYMPGYSGLEVCQRMKESPETSRIPVLLSVGKLEPFKPEEAQRVRAEGYIVKPFEASELLSALSKLEDKVVPRSESSRPGRFARAIAAVEDAGRGRGEDNGWKNRIAFPHEKTEAEQKSAEESSGEQSDGYNPVNRDLRTVVESREEVAEEKREQVKQEEAKQAQSKREQEEVQRQEAKLEEARLEEVKRERARREEDERQRASEVSAQASVDVSALAAPGASSAALPTDVTEEELAAITAAAAQMQMASASIQEELKADAKTEAATRSEESSRELPATIAANADSVAGSGSGTPRWTAVAVALEGEEASVSLDQEMQRAYASAQAAVIEAAPQEPTTSPEIPSPPQAFASEAPAAELAIALGDSAQPQPVPQPEPEAMPSSFAEAEPAAIAEAAVAAWQPERQETSAISETASTSIASGAEEPAADAAANLSDFATAASNLSEMHSPAPAQLEPAAESQFVPQQAESEPVAASQPATDGKDVKSTAAAWASWRQTRDTRPSDAPSPESQPAEFVETGSAAAEIVPETNAAAVAAGAEHILQAVASADPSPESSNSSHDVASIVDSVLADLRPKLMEEISRKMASKK
jgi:CheY-like chemotaxis protein